MTLTWTHTHTKVWVHAWAETDVLGISQFAEMSGMPRDGDPCAVHGCDESLRKGERAFAVIEVPRRERIREHGEAWVGDDHPTHRTWYDGAEA